jgi:hypothetical protein
VFQFAEAAVLDGLAEVEVGFGANEVVECDRHTGHGHDCGWRCRRSRLRGVPFPLPQVEARLQRIGPDHHAGVGEVHKSVDRWIVAWPDRAAAATGVAGQSEMHPVTTGNVAHRPVDRRHLVSDHGRRDIHRKRNLEAVQCTHVPAALRLRYVGKAIEPDRLAGARNCVCEVTRRLHQRLVGENLLFQLFQCLVAALVMELASIGGIRTERRKQIVLALGDPDPEIAVVRADNHGTMAWCPTANAASGASTTSLPSRMALAKPATCPPADIAAISS